MIELLAPAKVNLGLEVLGRRSDGYHEIRTIYCAVSCFDRLTIRSAARDHINCDRSFAPNENLAARAVASARTAFPELPPISVAISKRIPSAAGLGGASSDAAATLIGLNQLAGGTISSSSLSEIAIGIGSDVPYLLSAGLAAGAGRGESLRPIAFRPVHLVLVVPDVQLPDKTKTLYSLLTEADLSSGNRIAALARTLETRQQDIPGDLLQNAFSRPLYDLLPEVRELAQAVNQATGRTAHVTGAGPAHYIVCSDLADALRTRRCLSERLRGMKVRLLAVRSVPRVPISESPDD
jgi:4-diphosphocytidyl-2-C-methyl-D-erythritol kinase